MGEINIILSLISLLFLAGYFFIFHLSLHEEIIQSRANLARVPDAVCEAFQRGSQVLEEDC